MRLHARFSLCTCDVLWKLLAKKKNKKKKTTTTTTTTTSSDLFYVTQIPSLVGVRLASWVDNINEWKKKWIAIYYSMVWELTQNLPRRPPYTPKFYWRAGFWCSGGSFSQAPIYHLPRPCKSVAGRWPATCPTKKSFSITTAGMNVPGWMMMALG